MMPPWRVLCDANIYISYLIRPTGEGAIPRGVRFCLSDDCQLVVTHELLEEIRTAVLTKPDLIKRIHPQAVEKLVAVLLDIGELVSVEPSHTLPELRDLSDAYLLQACQAGDVDILVSGDLDLRSIRDQITRPLIVSPADLLILVEATYNK